MKKRATFGERVLEAMRKEGWRKIEYYVLQSNKVEASLKRAYGTYAILVVGSSKKEATEAALAAAGVLLGVRP